MALSTTPPTSICIYPVSAPYLPIHRYLYYTTLTLSILYPTPPPLIKGAFAYTLTISSTTALYTFLILSLSSATTILNADIFGLWSILAPATIAILPLLLWNQNLHSTTGRSSRLIVRFWGLWVIAATICTFVLLHRATNTPFSASETCSGSSKLKLRNLRDAEIVSYSHIFNRLFNLIVHQLSCLVFLSAAFGVVTCLADVSPNIKKTNKEIGPGFITDVTPSSGTYSPLAAIGLFFTQLRRVVAVLTPLMFIPVVVVNEMYLLRDGGIPGMEGVYEVGQWGLCAGLGFVALAALVDEVVGKRKIIGGMEEEIL